MALDPKDILAELKKDIYRPVYFLQGDEPYYIDAVTDWIEEKCLNEADKGFNQVVLYGKDIDMATIVSNAKRFPMMSERQVVIVKEAQEIKDIGKEEGAKQLSAYIQNPLSSTILVFAHKNKTLDGRKALGKDLNKAKVLINCKKMYDNQVPTWVQDYVKQQGHTIDFKAQQVLVDSAGTNLSKLSNEIQKILINFTEPNQITTEHIQKYVGISKDYNVFELQAALGAKDVLKSNKIIAYFAKSPKNHPAIMTISNLYGYFSKLVIAQSTEDKSDRGLAGALSVNPYFVKDYKAAMRNYPLIKLVRIISFIKEADMRVKGVGITMTEEQIVKELIFKILHI